MPSLRRTAVNGFFMNYLKKRKEKQIKNTFELILIVISGDVISKMQYLTSHL
jgi:hypothetical protein